jgi:hypothetical protein
VASVQFSRTVERRIRRPLVGMCGDDRDRLCPTTDGRRSLKTQQHAGIVADSCRSASQVVRSLAARVHPAKFGRHARPNRTVTDRISRPSRGHGPDGRCDRGTVVLPRKEVIQPQLPLRLPCSRGSPCRHGAWTISSSSLLGAKTRFEQTSLPRVPQHRGPSTRSTGLEELGV